MASPTGDATRHSSVQDPCPGKRSCESRVLAGSQDLRTGAAAQEAISHLGKKPRVQKKKNRCWTCNLKVGLMGFECRCHYVFCGKHRYAEEHACTFDYGVLGRQQIAEQNPRVVADKMRDRI